MNIFHQPVLLHKSIEYLKVQKGQRYIDATIGGGGHTLEILKKGGLVLGIDQDKEALEYCRLRLLPSYKGRINLVKGNFGNIREIAKENNWTNIAGIIFDLGVSSHQLDSRIRGFSFRQCSQLDMRMDQNTAKSALDIVNFADERTLYGILAKYGEELLASNIALRITQVRQRNTIKTTDELSEIIVQVYRERNYSSKVNPATKVFQALRIAVNDELTVLKNGLQGSLEILGKNGRLAVISYHSLEDRITKLFMKDHLKILTKRPIRADSEEISINKRSRSAKLRVGEKYE